MSALAPDEQSIPASRGEEPISPVPPPPAGGGRAGERGGDPDLAEQDLAEAALAEVRMALRGRTADELAAALGRERDAVEVAARALVAQGRLAARGPRFFVS